MELLNDNIDAVSTNIINVLETCKNKFVIVSSFVDAFSQHYVSRNLWAIENMTSILNDIEQTSRTPEICKAKIVGLGLFISGNEFKSHDIIDFKSTYSLDEDLTTSECLHHADLQEFEDVFEENVFNLINILYENLRNATNIRMIFSLIRYLLTNKKTIKKTNIAKLDMTDYIFLVVMLYISSEGNDVPDDVIKYVTMCKDIFYYRLKKKDKMNRINLLFYSILTVVNKKVKYDKFDYFVPVIDKPITHEDMACEYLFNVFNYDESAIQYMQRHKTEKQKELRQRKKIQVKGLPVDVNTISIEKI